MRSLISGSFGIQTTVYIFKEFCCIKNSSLVSFLVFFKIKNMYFVDVVSINTPY